jgi:hypothetical protein
LQWKRGIIDSWTSLAGARFRQTRTASRATHSRFLKFRTLGTLIASDWSKNLKDTIRFWILQMGNVWFKTKWMERTTRSFSRTYDDIRSCRKKNASASTVTKIWSSKSVMKLQSTLGFSSVK